MAGCPGTLQIRQYPGLEDRIGIDLAGLWPGPAFLGFHISCHRLIPTLPAVAAYLPRYHGHRSTNPIRSPPQRASFLQPLSDSRPVLYRQHTPHQQPLPDKHCCYDPMTPPGRSSGMDIGGCVRGGIEYLLLPTSRHRCAGREVRPVEWRTGITGVGSPCTDQRSGIAEQSSDPPQCPWPSSGYGQRVPGR